MDADDDKRPVNPYRAGTVLNAAPVPLLSRVSKFFLTACEKQVLLDAFRAYVVLIYVDGPTYLQKGIPRRSFAGGPHRSQHLALDGFFDIPFELDKKGFCGCRKYSKSPPSGTLGDPNCIEISFQPARRRIARATSALRAL